MKQITTDQREDAYCVNGSIESKRIVEEIVRKHLEFPTGKSGLRAGNPRKLHTISSPVKHSLFILARRLLVCVKS